MSHKTTSDSSTPATPSTPVAPPKVQMKHNLLFLSKFFRHGTRIASIWPSSKALSKATIKQVDWVHSKIIVELGAGTGPITDQIVKKLQPHSTLIAIERDADFAKILQQRFASHKNVEIVHADVRDLDAILKARHIKNVDAFISGLPTPSLPPNVRKRMLACVRRYLVDGGVFSNITEIPFYYWNYYKKYFKQVSFDFVVINMPPGGVYHCRTCK